MLSSVILTKNEEKLIKDCIESIKDISDEIVVIDSDSKDQTAEIAKKLGAKVYNHNFVDFSRQRNFSLTKVSNPWILFIDADERLSPKLKEEIRKAIASNHPKSMYLLLRKNFYLGNKPWPYIEKMERLFKKEALKRWEGVLHETVVAEGACGILEGYVLHYTHRTIEEMVAKTNMWSDFEARLRFDTNHPKMTWWRFFRVMSTAFYNSYIHQGGWKVGTVGLVESIFQAFSIFITYAKLWELQEKKDQK